MKHALPIPRVTRSCTVLLIAVAGATAPARRAAEPLPAASPATMPADQGEWLTTLDRGYADAAKRQRPMLVVYGAEWCGPCKMLQKEVERPNVKDALAGWTRVHLDVDKLEGATAFTGPIPTLRILTPGGKEIASREGYLSGEELMQWLSENAPKAGVVDPDLVGTGAPDAASVDRLVAKLTGDHAGARESAISRLLPWPQPAGHAVAEAFAKGNLRARLAALDLLTQWRAPVAGIDPWQPETVTAERVDLLRKWAGSNKPQTRPTTEESFLPDAQTDFVSLLRADDPAEADVISTRLARLGPAFLPQVALRLKVSATDRDRERLTALRYRLVATESLNQAWPNGIERLASADAQVRHAAADELAKRATADDQPLLLELFSDPDPLVREISLQGLESAGGQNGAATLAKLLSDPSSNVRAAVLKKLGEKPTPQTTAAVIAYIPGEKDPDLIVHAVRVLRAAKGDASARCLIGLLDHDNWRIRAEAIDSLGEIAQAQDQQPFPKDDAAIAVIKRLDDTDGFVAGRALAALKVLGPGASLDSMKAAVKRHPELALDVVKMVAGNLSDANSIYALRDFCKDANPAVRATAVRSLAGAPNIECKEEVLAALHDGESEVKAAGAEALFQVIESKLPRNGMVEQTGFLGFGGGMVKVNLDDWLADFRSGKRRINWFDKAIPELQALLKSDQAAARAAAAIPLAALGHDDEALPVIQAAAKTDENTRRAATSLLPWLPWEKRLALFGDLLADDTANSIDNELATQMVVMPDPRAAGVLWALLARDSAFTRVSAVQSALRQAYMGSQTDSGEAAADQSKLLVDAAQAQFKTGNDYQRLVALSLLGQGARDQAAIEARKLYEAKETTDWLRGDAFKVLLLTSQPDEARTFAITALAPVTAPPLSHTALEYLARGGDGIGQLSGGIWFANMNTDSSGYVQSGQPVVITPPAGVTEELVAPFLKDSDPAAAVNAGYLLCLLGKPQGLPPLLSSWRNKGQEFGQGATERLVYRAISVLDDDSKTPVLEEIYQSYNKQTYYIRELYWTIRGMHGPAVMKLRKTIRDEIGMPQLQ